MSAAVQLRPMRWQDLDRVTPIEQQSFPDDAWSEASWWAELAQRPRREYLVAESSTSAGSDTKPALLGYAGLDHAGDTADVMTIVVAPSARRAGLGRDLLAALLDRAGRGGAEHLLLEVRADNEPAIAMYRRAGFEVLTTRPGYYRAADGGSAIDAWVMRCQLTGGSR